MSTTVEKPERNGERAGERTGSAERWLLLFTLCAMQFALMAGDTAVNIALPSIRGTFGLTPTQLVWVVNGYTLAFGGLLVVAGRAGDKYGLVRMFTTGTTIFGVAAVACAVAPNASLLVAARFVQGIGAAMIAPAVLALITVLFVDERGRAKAFAMWSGTMVVGGTVGMLASGVLTEALSWRASFLITVPIALAGAIAAPRFARLAGPVRTPVRIETPTALLLTIAVTALLYGLLSVSTYGLIALPTLLGLVVGLLCSVMFVVLSRRTDTPLIPRLLLRDRTRVAALFAGMLSSGGMFSVFFVMTLFLRNQLHYGALTLSLAYVPTGVACLIGTWIAGRWMVSLGARRLASGALALSAAGILSLALLSTLDNYLALVPGLVLFTGGLSAAMPAMAQAAVVRVSPSEAGVCSAAVNGSQQLGGAIALAVTAVLSQVANDISNALFAAVAFTAAAAVLGLLLRTEAPAVVESE